MSKILSKFFEHFCFLKNKILKKSFNFSRTETTDEHIFFEKKKTPLWCKDFVLSFSFKCLILLLFFISISPSSIHASGDPSLKAWIDFIEEEKIAFVKGLFVNLSDQPESFDWEMNLHKETVAGKTDETFNGTFIAKPADPMMIAAIEVDLKKREYFVIVFNVFNKKKDLVGTDTLTSESIDPTLTPPQPKLPVVANDLEKPGMNPDAIEIDGLILDDTRTKIGRDFYELFYSKWYPPSGSSDFLITIKELPSRGIGARVSIEVNNNVVLNRFLQPRGDIVEEQANISIRAVQRYLEQNESLKKSMDSGDTAGSGIY